MELGCSSLHNVGRVRNISLFCLPKVHAAQIHAFIKIVRYYLTGLNAE